MIGAAWANPDGSISIVFDAFTVVPVGKDYVITAFPEKPKPEGKPSPRLSTKYDPPHGVDDKDEIPF